MITMTIAALVCLVGLIIFLAAKDDNPKVKRIGEIMFGVGLFIALWNIGGKVTLP